MSNSPLVPQYEPNTFDVSAYQRHIAKPWGYEVHYVSPETPYMLKLIHINAGKRLSLQMHDKKSESWTLVAGRAGVIWQDDSGMLITTELEPGKGYTTKIGQKHRLLGLTDCDIIEASTPEAGTTWRLEDDFSRPHETPDQRQKERRE